jgi:S1-C subfamily serine protease
VVPELIARGKYLRPSLGVSVDEDINRIFTKQLGVSGVMVLKVTPGSAAEIAGLRGAGIDARDNVIPGDIILSINGQAVTTTSDMIGLLDDYRIGDNVTLHIWRGGQEMDVEAVLQGEN